MSSKSYILYWKWKGDIEVFRNVVYFDLYKKLKNWRQKDILYLELQHYFHKWVEQFSTKNYQAIYLMMSYNYSTKKKHLDTLSIIVFNTL